MRPTGSSELSWIRVKVLYSSSNFNVTIKTIFCFGGGSLQKNQICNWTRRKLEGFWRWPWCYSFVNADWNVKDCLIFCSYYLAAEFERLSIVFVKNWNFMSMLQTAQKAIVERSSTSATSNLKSRVFYAEENTALIISTLEEGEKITNQPTWACQANVASRLMNRIEESINILELKFNPKTRVITSSWGQS